MNKERITKGISFPDQQILETGQKRAAQIGLRSFSEYINQLIRKDCGMANVFESAQTDRSPVNTGREAMDLGSAKLKKAMERDQQRDSKEA